MEFFDPTRTRLIRAIRLGRLLPISVLKVLAVLGLLAALGGAGFWIANVAPTTAWHVLVLAAGGAYLLFLYIRFFTTHLSVARPAPAGTKNLAALLDYDALRIATTFRGGDLALLLRPMRTIPQFNTMLLRLGITQKHLWNTLNTHLHSPEGAAAQGELVALLRTARDARTPARIQAPLDWRDLFLALVTESSFLTQCLATHDITPADLAHLLAWQREEDRCRSARERFWSRANLSRTRGIGHDWASGYTARLERYAVDLTETATASVRLYGHTNEVDQIEETLARDGARNIVLVGDPGVGKSTVMAALAERFRLGKTLAPIAYKRILRLDLGALLASSETVHDIENKLRLVFADALRAGNVILLIDDIHALFDDSHDAGTVNAQEVLIPFLASPQLQCVGMTTYDGYHDTIARNTGLRDLFEKIEVHEPHKEDVYEILHDVIPHIEAHEGVWILFQAVHAAVELADRYLKNEPFPEKAIDLLQEAAVYAQTKQNRQIVTVDDVEAVLTRKTGVPVGAAAATERKTLLALEQKLHGRVVGQDAAITALANALRRVRAGVTSSKRPVGSFLFLGPTGVGKTETAKALAAAYFGSEQHLLRFDMSEYQEQSSITRLIGHDDEPGLLTTAIADHPFSLILLDELEKAHPDILTLFLQVLDDGRLTNAQGRTVDFTNTLIIATSNAGAEMIRESAGAAAQELKTRVLEQLQEAHVFRPEFLNRFDAIIMFQSLSQAQERKVAALMIADLNHRLSEKGITVVADDATLTELATRGFDPQFGARPLRRLIQDTVENRIAQKLLRGELTRGDTYTLHTTDLDPAS